MVNILGISAFYHDSAAALITEKKIVAAAQEERFTRKKHDSSFPINSIKYVLSEQKINVSDLDAIVFYEKPFLKFERLLETYIAFAPDGFKSFYKSMPLWVKDKLFQKNLIFNELKIIDSNFKDINKIKFTEHHLSHAASAFYPSPFEEALVVTLDGVGEWATTTASIGKNESIDIFKEIHFPHSLGLLYSAMTYYIGFKVNSGEYKLMGLAPYGKPVYSDLIKKNLIDIKNDGSFALNMEYFNYCTGLTMTSKKFDHLFGAPPREPESIINQREMDLAASVQVVIEEVVLKLLENLAKETKQKNLCLAGGVALNCVANGKILKSNLFDNIWIQPAAGDAGGAIGAAYCALYDDPSHKRELNSDYDFMQGSYLGPRYSNDEVTDKLDELGAKYELLDEDKIIEQTAIALSEGKSVGWLSGRMEFGPRALGGRSILADPRSPDMQKTLNLQIKNRESFRPFAPSILHEDLHDWFELEKSSPYMLLVANILDKHKNILSDEDMKKFGIDLLNIQRSSVPAITHIDYSARVQTVHEETNLRYYKLLKKFKEITNCPILVNTSFNVRSEPIVCDTNDAFRCFMGTKLDVLIVEDCILKKENQMRS